MEPHRRHSTPDNPTPNHKNLELTTKDSKTNVIPMDEIPGPGNILPIPDNSNAPMILPDHPNEILSNLNRCDSNGNGNQNSSSLIPPTPKATSPFNAKKPPQRRIGINIKQVQEKQQEEKEQKSFLKMMQKKQDDNPKTKFEKFRAFLVKVLDSNIEMGVISFFSFLGLILSDISYLCAKKSQNSIFISLYSILIILSVLEIVSCVIADPDYSFSFSFYLDIFSIFSLLTEIDKVSKGIIEAIVGKEAESQNRIQYSSLVLMILKIIRLIRVFKIYRTALGFMKNYVIQKKLEKIKQKEIEKIKQLEKKIIHPQKPQKFLKKRTKSGIVPQTVTARVRPSDAGNMSNIYGNNSMVAGYGGAGLGISGSKGMEPQTPFKTQQTVQGILNQKDSSHAVGKNPNSSNILPINYGCTSPIPTNKRASSAISNAGTIAEFALKKMMHLQNEKKESLILQSKTETTQVLFQNFTKMLLLLTLLLFFLNPIIDTDLYSKIGRSNYQFLSNLIEINKQTADIELYVDRNYPVIKIIVNNSEYYVNQTIDNDLDHYRFLETSYVLSSDETVKVIFSNKKVTRSISNSNIIRTIILFVILSALSYFINNDTSIQILKPIDSMLEVVEVIAKDPVNAKTLDNLNKNTKISIERMNRNNSSEDEETSLYYKIKTVQNAVVRISRLIALCFGEAGGEILKDNINSEQDLNPMIPGKKIQAVFGFCYIRNFPLINEALQGKTISFVNTIALAIHSSAKKFNGECNKNIGDAFLFVWKFKNLNGQNQKRDSDKDKTADTAKPVANKTNNDYILKHKDDPETILTAESAVVSFLCALKKIYKSQTILQFRNDPQLKKKFQGDFKVKMGFGLHCGWGIEGTIGSFCKIDCSYLSPNVNTSARIETATNIFGVDILLSGDLYDCLTPFTKNLCRQVDTVALKGCLFPVKLFTVDVNQNLHPGKIKRKEVVFKEKLKRLNYKKSKFKSMYERMKRDETETPSIIEVYYKWSKGFREMIREPRSKWFLENYAKGFDLYIKGNWEEAHECLVRAAYIFPMDKPTANLVAYIKKNNKKAPDDWKGFKKLETKS